MLFGIIKFDGHIGYSEGVNKRYNIVETMDTASLTSVVTVGRSRALESHSTAASISPIFR